jgi:hypothetical protein
VTDNERRNDQAHRADESVGVAELVIAAHAYALMAMRLLNRADPVSLEPRGTEAQEPPSAWTTIVDNPSI